MIIKAVVFDYGGVLSRDKDSETFRVMADIAGVQVDELAAVYWPERAAYDRGAVDGRGYWKIVLDKCGSLAPDDKLDILVRLDALAWSSIDPVMLRWAWEVNRSGRITAVCSNIPPELSRLLFDNRLCRILPKPFEFSPVISSCFVESNKPEKAIYSRLLEKLSLPVENVLFIDDKAENAEGAGALGMASVVYRGMSSLMEEVKKVDPSMPVITIK